MQKEVLKGLELWKPVTTQGEAAKGNWEGQIWYSGESGHDTPHQCGSVM